VEVNITLKQRVNIRVDGSSKIGLGHLIRCIALAQMLKHDFEINFSCKEIPDEYYNLIISYDFLLCTVNSENEFLQSLNEGEIVVFDGYDFDVEYQTEAKKMGCKVVCIDDLHQNLFNADLIINHAPSISPQDYQILNSQTEFALGTEYALLRPAFLNQNQTVRVINDIKNVLICFGGADYLNLTLKILNTIITYPFSRIIVITGAAYDFSESLKKNIHSDPRIEHHHSVLEDELLELMLNTDLAVIPSSGILLEMMTTSARIICGFYADNQKIFFERFLKKNIFFSAYDFSEIPLKNGIEAALIGKDIQRESLDGKSGERILEKFIDLTFSIRKVAYGDEKLLFNWANDRSVRKNAISANEILWEDHIKWFNAKLISPDNEMYIMEKAGKPVGQIRYDRKDDYFLIDYSIDQEYRGMGYGKKVLKKTLPFITESKMKIRAIVKSGNLGSIKVFNALNFNFVKKLSLDDIDYHLFEY
jgi:UDP-2,4-diacetamido-2,4,6-trideoxy-beta-L-altropyranose hydrolase